MLSSILGSRGRRQFAQRLFQSQAHLCCVMQFVRKHMLSPIRCD